MEFAHTPVLLRECMENLRIVPDGVYVDGTVGGGGHAAEICERLSERGSLIGIDWDMDALEAAQKRLKGYACKKHFIKSDYSNIKSILRQLAIPAVDGALLDLGVSSFQLDDPERGFSYMKDAPLDMRMDRESRLTAYDVVNRYSRKDLARVISSYGEERWASRIASFIDSYRRIKPVESTLELARVIKDAIPAGARRRGHHPAKRTFQAIRIEVNDELSRLESAMEEFCDVLKPGGRLCVISFHSLEDRIVKRAIAGRSHPRAGAGPSLLAEGDRAADIRKISGKPIFPSEEEMRSNPRSRSARLRVCEKI